jgi:hypothetical protein
MSGGVQAALAALRLRRGPPDESDRPPLSTFPGGKRKPLSGQIDIFGREHDPRPHPSDDAAGERQEGARP